MSMVEQAAETAQALGISEKDALVLEFIAATAWAHVARNNKAEAIMHIGAKHAAGQISADTMHQCLAVMDATAARKGDCRRC